MSDADAIEGMYGVDLAPEIATQVADPSSIVGSALRVAFGTAFAVTLNPLNYGAVGDGTTDDTTALNVALAAAKTRGKAVVDGGGRTYRVTGKLTVDSVTLRNCTLSLNGVIANVRLTGTAPALRDATVAADSTVPTDEWGANGGMINLHAVTKALIDNVECTAATARRAVQCITTASYTVINNLRTYTAWGILYNDTSFITRNSIEGVDYSASSIGTGLTVTDSQFFGPSNAAWTGDGIEINTPAKRFSHVTVRGCKVWRTYTSSSVGLGIACANVDHVTYDGNYITNCPAPSGAFHVEFCTDAKMVNNTAYNCRVGMSVNDSAASVVTGNRFDSCWEFSFAAQSASAVSSGISLENNTFVGLKTANGVTAFNDIVIGNAAFVNIVGNQFLGFGETGKTHIQYLSFGSPASSVTHSQINSNIFASTLGFDASDLIFLDATVSGVHSSGNDFGDYLGPAAVFIDRIAAHGLCEDFYRASATVANAKGLALKISGNPAGWAPGAAGRVADDVTNGLRYRYDATASTWSIPGSSYTNPMNLGGAYLWVNAGTLRIKATAPTSATDGVAVGSQT